MELFVTSRRTYSIRGFDFISTHTGLFVIDVIA